jgi:hypothetical protein
MELEIIYFYCVADDLFKAMHITEDRQVCMNNAEVVTVSWVASWLFGSNWEKARTFLKEKGYIPRMLSKSRFCRRLHAIPEEFWQQLSFFLPGIQRDIQDNKEFIIDSFPLPACDNIRIKRRHLLRGEQYRGKCVSKRRYFLGIKVHVLMTTHYLPIEWLFTPGSESDVKALHRFNFNLPEGSVIYADPGYTDYQEEDLLREIAGIDLYAQRKSNSKRKRAGWLEFLITFMRKRVETGFSMLTNLLPKSIHAVTDKGFMIKCASLVTAFTCWKAMEFL